MITQNIFIVAVIVIILYIFLSVDSNKEHMNICYNINHDTWINSFNNNPETFDDMKKLANINSFYKDKIFIDPDIFISNKTITDDHAPFKEKGKYALNLIPYTFPNNHHTLEDNYKNVNWNYVTVFYNVLYNFMIN